MDFYATSNNTIAAFHNMKTDPDNRKAAYLSLTSEIGRRGNLATLGLDYMRRIYNVSTNLQTL